MAFLEWRKFTFFDLQEDADDNKLSEVFKDCEIVLATSGNSHLVFGDSGGQVHLVNRSWAVTTFRAYELRITLAQQLRNSPLLVTIGEDEAGINPLLKIWDTSRQERSGHPHCVRVSRVLPGNRAVAASTLCAHEGLQLIAVGFADGSLMLYRGDITRERGTKQKLLRDTSSTVTGLAFKSTAACILLFVATDSSVFVYNITHKDKEHKLNLDTTGCAKNCSVLAESLQDCNFMIGRDDAIYCYTSDGRGPCYAVEGEKLMLEWFRSYLIIVSKSPNRPVGAAANSAQQQITVLDIQNKFIVFSASVSAVKAVLSEWGAFYIVAGDNTVYHLDEKDLQSKLSLMFKKNLYDVAIRIAKSQQYDADGLVDIFRQYGDHLYTKGDHAGAMDQYVKTIGKLEASYIIRKFLDSQHTDQLITYLQALHKQGRATEDHTTLLLNCFTKIGKPEILKEFIMTKDRELDFDVEIAIKVCRQGKASEEALVLAKKHHKHDWYLKIQIEDHGRYSEALDYISELPFDDAELYMKKYGNVLIQNVPCDSTRFLKVLCTDYKPRNKPLVTERMLDGSVHVTQRADPEELIHLFLNNSARLVEFLEHLVDEGRSLSTPVYDTLLEHYLHVWAALEAPADKNQCSHKIVKLLQNPEIKYDKSQALVVCHMHGFSEGVLYLHDEQKLYQQDLRYHMARNDANSVLACCRRFGHQDRTLWVQALWSCVRNKEAPTHLLPEILTVIAKERLQSPELVIDAIGTGSADITLEYVRNYIVTEVEREAAQTLADNELINKYKNDTTKLREQLDNLKAGPVVIQGSRCAACQHPLELPSIHFLCQHSYHQHCFQSYADNENECPACLPDNKSLVELMKARDHNKDLNETFHSQLDKAPDGFALAAEYFGRGVFHTVTVVRDTAPAAAAPAADAADNLPNFGNRRTGDGRRDVATAEPLNYGPGAEARQRQAEGRRNNVPIVIPTSEARLRLQEQQQQQYSNSLEANVTKSYAPGMRLGVDGGGGSPRRQGSAHSGSSASGLGSSSMASDTLTANIVGGGGNNPFDGAGAALINYDEAKNPFADEEEADDKNPFKDDDEDDYDKNLNPFAS